MTLVSATDPFHEGERYVQERAGERDVALRVGGIVGPEIPARAVPFLAGQRMLVVGSVDTRGDLWASILFGAPGLASTPDRRSVVLDRTRIDTDPAEPVWGNLQAGAEVGLLAIELQSRRRLRINGIVNALDDRRVEVTVREAFPNCPKYIQRRDIRELAPGHSSVPSDLSPPASGAALDEDRSRVIERADTLFVASRHPTRGVDVSHRGGERGFVRLLDPGRLRIPDYRGNGMFQTLGNFAVNDHAGVVVPDFDRGTLLQLTGSVSLRFDAEDDPRQPTGGTGRYWDFHVTRWVARAMVTPLAWERPESSPHNPRALVDAP